MILFIQYPPCSTCQKAKKWLDSHKIAFTDRHIKEQNPTYEELKDWYQRSGLPLKKFFNTSGLLYKSLNLKDKLPTMSEEEQLQLLAPAGYRRDAGEAPHPCNREGHPHRLQRGRLGENIVIYAFTAS